MIPFGIQLLQAARFIYALLSKGMNAPRILYLYITDHC